MVQQVVHKLEHVIIENELIDAHCHLDMFDDPKTAISDAVMGGVRFMITSGVGKSTSIDAIKISNGESVFCVIGVDPEHAASDMEFVNDIADLIKTEPKIVGIGEVGLDYSINVDKGVQMDVFERQIKIAQDLDIPLVIHARKAIDDVIEVVDRFEINRALFHFFEGSEMQAKKLAQMGNFISIPPQESGRRKRIINEIDLSSIAVETDSPVVGKSPLDVIKTVEWIAEVKGVSFNDAAFTITQNVKKLFSL